MPSRVKSRALGLVPNLRRLLFYKQVRTIRAQERYQPLRESLWTIVKGMASQVEETATTEAEAEDFLLPEVVVEVEEVYLLLVTVITETKGACLTQDFLLEMEVNPHREEGETILQDQEAPVGLQPHTETCLHRLKLS